MEVSSRYPEGTNYYEVLGSSRSGKFLAGCLVGEIKALVFPIDRAHDIEALNWQRQRGQISIMGGRIFFLDEGVRVMAGWNADELVSNPHFGSDRPAFSGPIDHVLEGVRLNLAASLFNIHQGLSAEERAKLT